MYLFMIRLIFYDISKETHHFFIVEIYVIDVTSSNTRCGFSWIKPYFFLPQSITKPTTWNDSYSTSIQVLSKKRKRTDISRIILQLTSATRTCRWSTKNALEAQCPFNYRLAISSSKTGTRNWGTRKISSL